MLEVENIEVSLGGVDILRKVSLNVKEKEIVMILGRNGAGKTTTMKSIIGIVPLKKGRIIFNGKDITNLPPYKRAKMGIGYAPDDRKIFTDMTAKENIEVALSNSNKKNEVFKEVFQIFPIIEKLMNRKGGYLSGGEQKMLAIARALALSPKFLLLDEPLEGLAPIVTKHFYESIKKIRDRGISILIAESNLLHASKLADRIFVIERGEIIFEGYPEEVLKREEVLKVLRGF
ncbi:MAG: ABC transporter ATP-binding protein [Candidatus Aenigmatarchaeota archaeon]